MKNDEFQKDDTSRIYPRFREAKMSSSPVREPFEAGCRILISSADRASEQREREVNSSAPQSTTRRRRAKGEREVTAGA
jgi:hypothetical protein